MQQNRRKPPGIEPGTVLQLKIGGTPMVARVRRVMFHGRTEPGEDGRWRELDVFESQAQSIVIRRRACAESNKPMVEWHVAASEVEAAGRLDPEDILEGQALRELGWLVHVVQEV